MSSNADPKGWSKEEVGEFIRWLVEYLKVDGPVIPYDLFQIDGKLLFKIRKRNLERLFPETAVDNLWMHIEALKFGECNVSGFTGVQGQFCFYYVFESGL